MEEKKLKKQSKDTYVQKKELAAMREEEWDMARRRWWGGGGHVATSWRTIRVFISSTFNDMVGLTSCALVLATEAF